MNEYLISFFFILFLIYYIRFVRAKTLNPNKPNGTFIYQDYVNLLINKYEKTT